MSVVKIRKIRPKNLRHRSIYLQSLRQLVFPLKKPTLVRHCLKNFSAISFFNSSVGCLFLISDTKYKVIFSHFLFPYAWPHQQYSNKDAVKPAGAAYRNQVAHFFFLLLIYAQVFLCSLSTTPEVFCICSICDDVRSAYIGIYTYTRAASLDSRVTDQEAQEN